MKINDIEFLVALFIGDLNDKDGEDLYFSNFDEFNDFIEKNQGNPKYSKGPFYYTIVEEINGEAAGYFWISEIEFAPFTRQKILEEIELQREFLEDELPRAGEEMEKFAKEIHYIESNISHKDKLNELKDYVYVCPNCLNEVQNCRCLTYPYYLVQIDRLMLPIIKELNMKGYKTAGCCAGHPKETAPFIQSIYIKFDKAYDFDEPIPKDGGWSKISNTITFTPNCKNYEEALKFQRECLYKIYDWAEMLFEIEEGEDEDDQEI